MTLALAAAALTLVAAEPPRDTAVISVIWPDAVPVELGERIELDVRAELAKSGVHLTSAASARMTRGEAQACGKARTCFAALAQRLGASFAVRVEPAAIAKDVAVLVQAYDVSTGKAVSEVSASVPVSSLDRGLAHALEPLVAALAAPAPTSDAPTVVASTPEVGVEARRPGETKVALEPIGVEEPAAKSHGALPMVLLGGGVALGIAGGVFAALGSSALSSYRHTITPTPDGLRATSLTAAQRQSAVSGINLDFTLALSSALAAVVLAGLGAGLFALE